MAQYQSIDQSDMISYYQIAGIHGRPFVRWDNVAYAPGGTGGYCTHSSTLFPTWHRPYLALFEQVLYRIVQDIAASFENSTDYRAAATTFRVPYWDWLLPAPVGQDTMPTFISSSAPVLVNTPNGTQKIPNPLYRYHFSPLDSSQFPDYPFSAWPNTLRAPSSNVSVDATSRDTKVTRRLDKNQATYSKRYLNLVQAYSTYEKFSNKAWMLDIKNPGGSYDSLESLHDAVHGLIGNGGHFTYNEYSAFDPVFMLHHANVDRLFAIWQTIYPSTYVNDITAASGTATIVPGDLLTSDTPLTPFHASTNGTFWTSAAVRDTRIFGYTYPETADNNASCATQAVNCLYGNSAGRPANQTIPASKSGSAKRDGLQQPGLYYEWITNIRVAQMALDSTFSIFVFLGNFSSDPHQWFTEVNLVGYHTVFKPFSSEAQPNISLIVAGTVPLTKYLNENAKAAGYNTANTTAVEAYLTNSLHWRIAKLGDNTEVSRDSLPSLTVSVVSCPVTEAESEYNFPDWGDCTPLTNITDSKVTGLSAGEPT